MSRGMRSAILAASLVGTLCIPGAVLADSVSVSPAPGGAYEQLSTGNQKIALALYEAQKTNLPAGSQRMTLDRIAAQKKPGGEGWGQVFKTMKSQGLVDAKNLGQVVSAYNHRHHTTDTGSVTTAGNRPESDHHASAGATEHGAKSGHDAKSGPVTAAGGTSDGAHGGASSATHGGGRSK